MRRLLKPIELFVFIFCLFMIGGSSYFVYFLFRPFHTSEEHEIVYIIKRGNSLRDVAKDLTQNHHLRAPYFFILLAIVKGVSRHLRAGEYVFSSSVSAHALLNKFVNGEVKQHRITFVAGWTFKEVLEAIYKTPFLIHTTKGLSHKEILEKIGIKEPTVEGLLFPDTYFFTSGTSDLEVLRTAQRTLQMHLQKLWQTRSSDLPYRTSYDGLILASLIEKETSKDDERARIAGVFIRRLKKNMKLESDPTVIYGLGERYKGTLLKRHLTDLSIYNTYIQNGLPPTPIALVGLASMKAAFSPEVGTHLYFVADGNGGHFFSNTLYEHRKAIARYTGILIKTK